MTARLHRLLLQVAVTVMVVAVGVAAGGTQRHQFDVATAGCVVVHGARLARRIQAPLRRPTATKSPQCRQQKAASLPVADLEGAKPQWRN